MQSDKESKDVTIGGQQEPAAATESGTAHKLNMSIEVIVSYEKCNNNLPLISQIKDFFPFLVNDFRNESILFL